MLPCPAAIPTVKLYSLSSEFEEVEATLIQQQRRSEILADRPIVVKKSKPISAMEGITNNVGGDDVDEGLGAWSWGKNIDHVIIVN